MRLSIKRLVGLVAETLPIPEPIFEFGSLQVPGQEGFADLRPLFPGKPYVGCDMRPGPGVDRVLDLHQIDLADGQAGTVFMLDTLEHVEYPHRAIAEIDRILKPGGMLVMTSVMCFPIHDFPFDYWRFTPEAFRSLLKGFESVYVTDAGGAQFPVTVAAVAFKGPPPAGLSELRAKIAADGLHGSLVERLTPFIPPILWTWYARSKGRAVACADGKA